MTWLFTESLPVCRFLWLVPAHGLFFLALLSYLRVYRAADHHKKLGSQFQQPPREPPRQIMLREVIFQCEPDGSPIRCWKNGCRGSWKPPRHCGDCATCRLGFDHHCAWFDNDICSPETLRPFCIFLITIPFLVAICLGPLVPVALSHTKAIWEVASNSEEVYAKWWSKRYSWLLGPAWRWGVGFILGAEHFRSNVTLDAEDIGAYRIISSSASYIGWRRRLVSPS
ncbi:hypothetical protein IE53DRAFT_100864 [Violaceomyces palustris]|uniref:Uncharacterized protein n=1 Tax=Violaceomyces palustris TaxID=1673888 RepID=A0ACD0P6W8_9BASI|nr:hypothetical protein IE53DRAFT_100864 [Violaceomyces palustris]